MRKQNTRDSEYNRQTGRQKDRQRCTKRETHKERHTQSMTEIHREKERVTERGRIRQLHEQEQGVFRARQSERPRVRRSTKRSQQSPLHL